MRLKLQSISKINHFHQFNGPMSTKLNQVKCSKSKENPDGIFVQVLPVVLTSSVEQHSVNNMVIKPSENVANKCKILLCKWSSGDFKDRYTGLIKSLPRQEYDNILQYQDNGRLKEKHDLLLEFAKGLIPSALQEMLGEMSLVGLLRFQDPPVYDEYIHLANLTVPNSNNDGSDSDKEIEFFKEKITFGDNPCYWFSWNTIPFHEMPADDELWYPKVLQQQEKVKGSFTFGGWSEKTIKSFDLQTVEQIE